MTALKNNMFLFMLRTAWAHAGVLKPRIVLFYGLFFVANTVLSLQPVVLAHIINAAQKGGPSALSDALLWSLLYGSLTLFFWMLHGPARVIERRVAYFVYRDFVASLYRKVTEMPLRWHQDHHSGNIINRVNKAGRALSLFSEGQFVIIQTTIRFLASMVFLACYSWWVALISLASSTVILFTIRHFDKTLLPLVRKTNEADHRLNAALYDYIGNIVTVLTLRLQGNTSAEIENRFASIKVHFWPQTLLNEMKWGALNLMLIATQAGIVGAYIFINLRGEQALALGSVVAIFQYLLNINQLFFQGTLSYEQLMYQHTDVRGVDELILAHQQIGTAHKKDLVRSWQSIHIQKLCFTHQEGEDALHHLRDVHLRIEAGQKIALIGGSGSGKTTLLTLLRGLYDAQQVVLKIGDDAFRTLGPLSGFTTLIPQDTEIFENTVRYNLTLGTEVPDAIVDEVLSITTFEEVLPKMPEGLDTDIRERGVNLSGGQKQRLALARGLIAARNSSLLLLDEPTSSVDLPTEAVIFDRLFAIYKDKAIIASVHRLHLLPRFDHIVFMRDGVILEQGSFSELLANEGDFYLLWQHHLTHRLSTEEEKVTL